MTLSKSKTKYIQSLKEKKFRDQYKTFVAEGDKMVRDLLPTMDCEILLATHDFIDSEIDFHYKIHELIEVTKSELEKTSFLKTPQQVLAVFRQPEYALDIPELSNRLSLVLDGIQDPGNLGTIIRLADWYGIENIICSRDTVDVYNSKVVQATMGALARIKVHYVDLTEWLKNIGNIPVYGTFLEGKDMYRSDITQNGLIIMGNEGNGIRPEVEQFVSQKLYIPRYPEERTSSESLNVAVATAIVCSEFRRRVL